MREVFETKGTCCTRICLDIEDDIIKEVEFINGCNGNLKGISNLVKGKKAQEVAELLRGTDCKARGTSCPDQLAQAIDECFNRR